MHEEKAIRSIQFAILSFMFREDEMLLALSLLYLYVAASGLYLRKCSSEHSNRHRIHFTLNESVSYS